jgi:hypothetical protein
MRFTEFALAAISALALFIPTTLADCHYIGDACNKAINHNKVHCLCYSGQGVAKVRKIMFTLLLIGC